MDPAATLSIAVKAQTSMASGELRKFSQIVDKVDRKKIDIPVDVDTVKATAELKKLDRQADQTGRSIDRNMGVATQRTRSWTASIGDANKRFTFMRNMIGLIKWPALISGAGAAAQAIGALAAGATALVAALAPLAGALVAYPAILGAFGQAFGTVLASLSGVGNALTQMQAAQDTAGTSAKTMASQVKSASDAVRSAEEQLAASHRNVTEAQEALTQARQDARRELVDLRLAEEGAALGQKRAVLALQEARRTLRETQMDPTAGVFDRRDALLAVQEAELNVRQARIDSRRATKDLDEAERKGVSGSDQVVAARRALADAERGVADASRQLAEAQKAQADATKATSTQVNNLQIAMNKLSPAAQKFARFLFSLKPKLDELRATAGQAFLPGLTRGIQSALKNFGALQTVLRETGEAMGRTAEKAGKFVGSRGFGRDFEKIGKGNAQLLERLGSASIHFASALRHVMVAAQPFIDFIGKGINRFAKWIEGEAKAGRETGKLHDFFAETKDVIKQLVDLGGSLGRIFLDIGHAAKPLGDDILATLVDKANKLAEWTSSNKGQNSMAAYFERARGPLVQAGKLLRDIVKEFFAMGKGSGLTGMLKTIRKDLLPALADVARRSSKAFGPALVDMLTQVAKLLATFMSPNGALTLFVKALSGAAKLLNGIFKQFPQLQTVASTALTGFSLYKLLGIGKALGGLGKLGGMLGGLGGKAAGGGILGKLSSMFGERGSSPANPLFVEDVTGGLPGAGGKPVPTGGVPGSGGMIEKIFQKVGLGGAFEALGGTTGLLTKVLGPAAAAVAVGKLIDTLGWFDAGGPISKIPALSKVLGIDKVSFTEKEHTIGSLAGAVKDVGDQIEKTGKVSRKSLEAMADQIRKASDAGLDMSGEFDQVANKLKDKYGTLLGAARHMSDGQRDAFIDMARAAHDAGDMTDKQFGRVMQTMTQTDAMWERHAKHIADVTGNKWRDVGRVTEDMKVKVAKQYDGMVKITADGLTLLTSNTNRALRSLGIKRQVQFQAAQQSGELGPQGFHLQNQRGSAIRAVGGYGDGDKIPAMLEPGEVVVNRNAVRAMGGAHQVNKINQIIPRFAQGGIVRLAEGGFLQLPKNINPTHETAGLPGYPAEDIFAPPGTRVGAPVAGVVSRLSGQAGGPGGGGAYGYSIYENGAGRSYYMTHFGNILTKVGAHVKRGTVIGTVADYPGGIPDHIHEGVHGGTVAFGGDTRSGGAAVATQPPPKIKRVVLKGPDGPLKAIGQAALDKVHRAANAFIARHAPTAAPSGAPGSSGSMGGFTAAPANERKFGDNRWVDSHTLAVTAALDKKFGLTMSSGYRSPAHNAAIHGAPGSLHTHGSPSNPGATDSVGPMSAMQSYIAYAKSHVAGLLEAMVDNYAGLGYNAHLGFFRRGGIVGGEPLKLAKGGKVPDALQRFDKVYPSAVYPSTAWSNLTQIPDKYIAAMAEWAGDTIGKDVPGVTMMAVQHGEGANRPGSRSSDGGYGLWGITIPWGNDLVGPYGGYPGMNNPISNALVMAKMYPPGWHGGSPWYGTGHMGGVGWNEHYTGKLLETSGGGGGSEGGGGGGGPTDAETADSQAAAQVPSSLPKTISGCNAAIKHAQEMKKKAKGPKEKAAWKDRIAALRLQKVKLLAAKHQKKFGKKIAKYAAMGKWPERLNRMLTDWQDKQDIISGYQTMGDFVKDPEKVLGDAYHDELDSEMHFREGLIKSSIIASRHMNELQSQIDAENLKKPDNRKKWKISAWTKGIASLQDFLDTAVGSNITDLQGTVKNVVPYQPPYDEIHNPPYGSLRGAILDTQTNIRQLRETGGTVDYQALAEIASEMAAKVSQQLAVSQAQYGVLAGTRATGGPINRRGLYLVGERGPEVLNLQAGGYVHSDPPTVFTATAEPSVDVGVFMHPDARKATVTVNGRQFDREVKQATRGYGRRPLPGARGR